MNIHIATDHAGFELKEVVKEHLSKNGYSIMDHGAYKYYALDDYPDFNVLYSGFQSYLQTIKGRRILFIR